MTAANLARRVDTELAALAPEHRWPTPDFVKIPISIYRLICLVVGHAAILAALMRAYSLAAVFGAVAIFALVAWSGGGFFNYGYKEALSHAAQDYARASAPAPAVPSARWRRIPAAPNGQGYLYVIRFATGVVKVGQTNKPARRFSEHRRDAWAYNVAITSVWISKPHAGHLDNEAKLIAFARTTARWVKQEYFHDADFEQLVDFAASLANSNRRNAMV